ncbi:MAG: glycosyltransferase family 4 protein [Armatimonadota bacterium]|nr:glycosyltransferase family 4 protein [Armatimonadota bacterium]
MRVCLYLELEHSASWSGGIYQAYQNHRRALREAGITVTADPDADADVLHLETLGPRSFYLAEKYSGVRPLVIHAHTTAEDFANSFVMSDLLAPHLGRLLTRYYNKADLVIAPTEYTRRVLVESGVERPIEVISNGVDLARFASLRRARSLGRGRYRLTGIVVFAVGLVLLRKGVDVFVDVARALPHLTFVWFGRIHRAVKPETLRIVDEAPPNVRFPGYVDNINEAYAAGDIFFFPSAVENEGIAVLEAAAAGRPLVLRDAECFAGRFTSEVNCLLAADVDGFCRQIMRLANDPAQRCRFGREARRFAERRSLDRIGAALHAAYGRVLTTPAARAAV